MKLIDEKGKIFSFINIIDFAIILVIVVLVISGFYKVKYVNTSNSIEPKPVHIRIFVAEREDSSLDKIKVGDVLKEYDTGIILGTIRNIDVKPSTREVETIDGEIKLAEVPDLYDYYIDIDGEAIVTENSIMSGNKELRVGSKLVLRTKIYALNSIILEIEEKQE